MNREASGVTLPAEFSPTPEIVWERDMDGDGISGLVSDGEIVVVADRNRLDSADVFRALDLQSGEQRWKLEYSSPSQLDYGNSPRATPLIAGDRVFLLGASGHLHAVDRVSGRIAWKTHLVSAMGGTRPKWGFSGSPLLIDARFDDEGGPGVALIAGTLIVMPGGADAGLAALDAVSGELLWKSPGCTAGYASPLLATFAGRRQIVGYDARSLGGWDPESGERLWEIVPKYRNDFNVPSPVPLDDRRLLVVTENNAARIYRFNDDGIPEPEPVSQQRNVAHDCNTPVHDGGRIYAVARGLHCLDAADLRVVWTIDGDGEFDDYATLVAGGGRLLVSTYGGEVLLIDTTASGAIVSRWRLSDEDDAVLSHPAVVGDFLLVRSTSKLVCVRLR